MANLVEGFRRIAIVVASLCSSAWVVTALIGTEGFTRSSPGEVAVILVGAAVAYFVPWGIIRAIGWALAGFQSGAEDRSST